MPTGTITKYSAKYGYGFIKDERGGVDIYFRPNDGLDVRIGDSVDYVEYCDREGKVWASEVRIIKRAAETPKPKPQTASIKRRGAVTTADAGRAFMFLKDHDGHGDVFVDVRVAKRCGVKLMRGDVVEYEIDPAAPQTGKCPSAVSVRSI